MWHRIEPYRNRVQSFIHFYSMYRCGEAARLAYDSHPSPLCVETGVILLSRRLPRLLPRRLGSVLCNRVQFNPLTPRTTRANRGHSRRRRERGFELACEGGVASAGWKPVQDLGGSPGIFRPLNILTSVMC